MHTATCPLDTDAGINLVSFLLFSPQFTNGIKRKTMPHIRTDTLKPLRLKRTILLHVRLGNLFLRIWFGNVHNLLVDMLLGTFSIDCFIRQMFSAKRKVVSCRSHPEAILSATPRNQHIRTSTTYAAAPFENL